MDRTNNNNGQKTPKNGQSKKTKRSTDTFTSDMHFIVTRNKRNVWQDEMYDCPPTSMDLPVFN